jgi:tetratricopeptide (TPR) repeat protein
LPDIKANAPPLAAEADAVKLTLSAKVSQGTKDLQELEQRINESSNKIETLISEADKTDKKDLKYTLLNRASILALKEEKFRLAVDLIEKMIGEQNNTNSPNSESRNSYYDQQLMQVTEAALGKDEIDSAEYALGRIEDDLKKADTLRRLADYFNRKKDSDAALDAYDEAFKLTVKADDNILKYSMLLRLIGSANAIDRSRLSEIISITARAINKIPPLDVEDKPGTQNFMNYASIIMSLDLSLSAAASNLSKTNKNEAVSFINRIHQKEIRIIADLALALNTFEIEKKQITK